MENSKLRHMTHMTCIAAWSVVVAPLAFIQLMHQEAPVTLGLLVDHVDVRRVLKGLYKQTIG